MPWAWAAMPMRPLSKVVIAILNPMPSAPSKFSFGMAASSKMMLLVEEARMPSFSSFLPRETPGVFMGTTKALMPLCFLLLSVVAKTMVAPAGIHDVHVK